MIVKDLEKLLPHDWQIPNQDGVLYIPSHGIPLHPKSLERLLSIAKIKNKIIAFRPEIPVSSKLGLPQYPVLAYFDPKEPVLLEENKQKKIRESKLVFFLLEKSKKLANKNLWKKLFQKKSWKNIFNKFKTQPVEIESNSPIISLEYNEIEIISETDLEEQEYYFADCFQLVATTPIQVSVVVGNTCNLKCVMCPYHSPEIKPTHTTDFFKDKNWISWEMMERLAEECGADQLPVKIGNVEEPLLHPRIIDFVRICRQKGVPSVHITTNGQLLNQEKARELLKAGLTSVYISIDAAHHETYARVRGSDYNRVESNLRNFLQVRKELTSSCKVMVSFVRNHGVSQEEEHEFLGKWLEMTDGVIFYNLAEYEHGNARFNKINDIVNDFIQQTNGRWACLNPWQEMYILPDGRVYYCCETVSKLAFEELESMGDYNKQTLREIWSSSLFNQLRKDLIRNELSKRSDCNNCGIWMGHVSSTEERNGVKVSSNMITEIYQQK